MPDLLFDVFNGCSSSIEEINTLIWKGMSNILRKTDVLKASNLKKCTNFEEQNGTRYIQGNILVLSFSAVFILQNCASNFFKIVLFGR